MRVRLRVDDCCTTGQDAVLQAFAAQPDVEVRTYTPLVGQRNGSKGARFVTAVGNWKRVNHRLHNKLLIDADAFVVGFVVAPLQALFDRYRSSLRK